MADFVTDALIIGAGPVGLFQVFELGLREIAAHVVDALPAAGGQCIELYGDKPIYDIPALPACTGRELTERLLEQARPFAPAFHFGQLVSAVARTEGGRFEVLTRAGLRFGLAVALVSVIPQFLIGYTIQPLPGALVCKQIAFDTVRYLLLGLLVAYLQPRRLVL